MQLSIIIINYNVKYFLEQCLCSVYKAIQHIEAEVWVVDNASSDNSIAYLKTRFRWVKFIENNKNVGFAKANNLALSNCTGKYVLFLNPDTLIPENSLIKCISFIESNEHIGALGVRMIDGSGTFLPESKRSFPSPLSSFYKLAGVSSLFPKSKFFSRYSLTYLDEFKNYEVDVLAGAFMLVQKNVLRELNGFDEDFFMYGEDIDLSYRIQKSGYKNYYFSESTIIHFKGESTKKNSLRYVKMFYEAMSIFVRKYSATNSAYLFSFFLQVAIWLRAGVSVAAKTKQFLLNALLAFYRNKRDTSITEKQEMIAVVGEENEYQEVKNLLTKAGLAVEIAGRVSTNERKESALGNIAEINLLIKTLKIKQIIFCPGVLSYSFIIDIIQTLKSKVSIRFHSLGSESIVGSDSRDALGEVVVANKNNDVRNTLSNK